MKQTKSKTQMINKGKGHIGKANGHPYRETPNIPTTVEVYQAWGDGYIMTIGASPTGKRYPIVAHCIDHELKIVRKTIKSKKEFIELGFSDISPNIIISGVPSTPKYVTGTNCLIIRLFHRAKPHLKTSIWEYVIKHIPQEKKEDLQEKLDF